MNTLSNLFPNMGEHLSLLQPFYALMFLGENGEHFGLNGLHLVVELFEACHLTLVSVYLGLQ